MSRSTNASKGTPDDDEGRLGDDRDELTDEASDAVEDEVVEDDIDDDDDADQAEPAKAEPDEAESDEAEPEKAVAASKPARSAAQKRSAGTVESARSGRGKAPAKPSRAQGPVATKDERRGPIAAIVLFVRQVIAELRKVVTPTTKELWTYSAVVIVFVLIVMAYVGVLDFAVGKLVLWAFGG